MNFKKKIIQLEVTEPRRTILNLNQVTSLRDAFLKFADDSDMPA